MIRIDKNAVIVEFTRLLNEYTPIVRLTDTNGLINIPVDKFLYFCHDIGILFADIMEKNAEIDEKLDG